MHFSPLHFSYRCAVSSSAVWLNLQSSHPAIKASKCVLGSDALVVEYVLNCFVKYK